MAEFGTPSLTQHGAIRKSLIKTGQEVFEEYLHKNERINENDFEGIYSREEIKNDKKKVEQAKLSENYEKPTTHSVVLENLISDVAVRGNWVGNRECAIIQLSEFDDIADVGAHCDAVLEMRMEDNSIIRLGIDYTTAVNANKLNDKKNKCFDGVIKGKLFKVKYFKSELTEYVGAVHSVPVVVFGLDKDSLHELCESVGRRGDLAKRYTQHMFIEEVLHQLELLTALSITKNGGDNRITEKIDYYREIFQKIAEEKNSLRSEDFEEKAAKDQVYSCITKYI